MIIISLSVPPAALIYLSMLSTEFCSHDFIYASKNSYIRLFLQTSLRIIVQVYFKALVSPAFLEFINSQTETCMWFLGSQLRAVIVNISSSSEKAEGYQLALEWLLSSK